MENVGKLAVCAVLWIPFILCIQVSGAIQRQPIFHSEEEYDAKEPPFIFPTKKIVSQPGDALEAADMLNVSNIEPGDIVKATELVKDPKVVDLGGKTHEENGNNTDFESYSFSQRNTEDVCAMAAEWLHNCEEKTPNLTSIDEDQKEIGNIPFNYCNTVIINNETKVSCSLNSKWVGEGKNLTNVICQFPEELFTFLNKKTSSSCPDLRKLFSSTLEPTFIFPTKKIVSQPGDMLNVSNIEPGDIVKATEVLKDPKVVDLGGKTHEENGNNTDFEGYSFLQRNTEDVCAMAAEWLHNCEEKTLNLTSIDEDEKEIGNIPFSYCNTVIINNETKVSCSLNSEWVGEGKNLTNVICQFPEELFAFLNKKTSSSCPDLRKLFSSTLEPTFKCSDKEEGNIRTTICQIPKQWLKDENTTARLNCTNSSNSSTDTETCIISKEIVQKNITHLLNCSTLNDDWTVCVVPNEWMKYNVFSKLNCSEETNASVMFCHFPKYLLNGNITYEKECNEGNKTRTCFLERMNCIPSGNHSEVQCHIPHGWLSENKDGFKLNCTNDHSNETQKICSIPQEWLRNKGRNNTNDQKQNSLNEQICLIPRKWLFEEAEGSGLNCTTNVNVSAVNCRAPNEGVNISEAVCPFLNKFKTEDAYHCTITFEGNDTLFYCEVPENNITVNTKSVDTVSNAEDVRNTTLAPQEQLFNYSKNVSTFVDKYVNDTNCDNGANGTELCLSENTNSTAVPMLNLPNEVTATATEKSHPRDETKLNTEISSTANYSASDTVKNFGAQGIPLDSSSNKINADTNKKYGHYVNEINEVEPAATPEALSQLHSDHTHTANSEKSVSFLRPTESAAILVGVFIAFAVIGYAGLLIWRRMLEKRYGNRQLLINEDDDFTNNFEMPQYELHERFWPKGVEKGVSSCDTARVTSRRSDLPMT